VFPSLGPTAFLLFFATTTASASPRNTFSGHLIGVLCGYLALLLFGLADNPPDLEDVTWARAGAVTLALCATLSLMVWLNVPHAPAGATTLIVALGLLRTPFDLGILMLAVIVMIGLGVVINRLAGFDYPLWSPHLKE
jgi:CBS-domain-containing membrane protein